MSEVLRPASPDELCAVIADAADGGRRLQIHGGGSKAAVGAPHDAAILDMTGFAGVIDYDPAELVLTAGAGTPLAEVEALVAGSGQMLAFDPFDHASLLGGSVGRATIGGVVAAGVAGSARLSAGGARDHLLGFGAVSGRGEPFVGGAKVVKNVTGYDLPKLVAGSWGRLVALTSVTLKVLPRSRATATLVIDGLDAAAALAAMAAALASSAEISAAAHVPRDGTGRTAFRLGGFEPSVTARLATLHGLLAAHGSARQLCPDDADRLWRDVRDAAPLARGAMLWRIVLPASRAAGLVGTLEPLGACWLFDWAGGLVWLTLEDAQAVRAAASAAGGHAMLVRAPAAVRRAVPTLHPQLPAVARLEERVRRAFDPAGVFETGRFDAH